MKNLSFLLLFFLFHCMNNATKEYHVNQFKEIALKKDFSGIYSCKNEAEAKNIAGSYIYTALQNKSFPKDFFKLGGIANFKPLCIEISEIDSVFTFSNYIPGGYHEIPCQIDVNFKNGNTFRFCFVNLIFNPQKIECSNCPENIQFIIEKYQDNCN